MEFNGIPLTIVAILCATLCLVNGHTAIDGKEQFIKMALVLFLEVKHVFAKFKHGLNMLGSSSGSCGILGIHIQLRTGHMSLYSSWGSSQPSSSLPMFLKAFWRYTPMFICFQSQRIWKYQNMEVSWVIGVPNHPISMLFSIVNHPLRDPWPWQPLYGAILPATCQATSSAPPKVGQLVEPELAHVSSVTCKPLLVDDYEGIYYRTYRDSFSNPRTGNPYMPPRIQWNDRGILNTAHVKLYGYESNSTETVGFYMLLHNKQRKSKFRANRKARQKTRKKKQKKELSISLCFLRQCGKTWHSLCCWTHSTFMQVDLTWYNPHSLLVHPLGSGSAPPRIVLSWLMLEYVSLTLITILLFFNGTPNVCMYIYIYVYTYVHTYIYIKIQ